MQLLSPWSAILAAAISLPLLLLLYFLKLRRQTLRIPSTLLWARSFEDLQVNAPFQRLRWSMLLVLQLLVLCTLLLAFAEPLWRDGGTSSAARVVILIDRSGSMSAPVIGESREPGEPRMTRFDFAKQHALQIIESLGRGGGPSQAMLISFGSESNVISGFESNRGVLRDAVNALTPSDEESDLEAALDLASAFAGSRDESADLAAAPEVVLLSDGTVSAAGVRRTFTLRAGNFRYVQVARSTQPQSANLEPAVDNLGFVALGARREYEDPARVAVFSRLLNAGEQPIEAIVTVSVDGRPVTTVRITVPGAEADVPGEAPCSASIDLPRGGVIALRHNHRDQLAADDVVAIVVPPPTKPSIVLVHPAEGPPDPYLVELLTALEPDRIQTISDADWGRMNAAIIDTGKEFDLVVFDRVSDHRLPGIPSITFGGVPSGIDAIEHADNRGQSILSWDRHHPVMRHLALDSIVFSGFGAFSLPESGSEALALGPKGPVIMTIRTRGARHVLVGYAMRRSNWSLHVSSAMFVQNALEYLTMASGSSSGGDGIVHQPGRPISVRAQPGASALLIAGGGMQAEVNVPSAFEAEASLAPSVTVPAIARTGLYTVTGAQPPHEILAISMLSDIESDIRPRDALTVNAQSIEATPGDQDQPMPLWPWLLAIALSLAALEWLVYCRRIT